MAKIEKLTAEQEAKFPVYVDKWLKIGLSCASVEKVQAESALDQAYVCAGLTPPVEKVWCVSPLAGAKLAAQLTYGRKKVTKDEIREMTNQVVYAQHDYWLSYYDYIQEELGVDLNKINGLIALSKECGWCWVFEDIAVMTERPVHVRFDDQKRAHSASGPAILYPDGFAVYVWHGTRIPGEWIEKTSKQDIKKALTWPNIEQRRCFADIVGWAKILDALKPKVIDEDPDPMIGTLLEVDLPDSPKERFLRVLCGTGRTFCIPVDPASKTALEANARTYGITDPAGLKEFRNYQVRT